MAPSLQSLLTGRKLPRQFRVLCIGDFSSLLGQEHGEQCVQRTRSSKHTSLFKSMLGHLRSQHAALSSQHAPTGTAVLEAFWKESLPSPHLAFLQSTPKLSKEKVMMKMREFLKKSGFAVLIITYIGESNSDGSWIFGGQALALHEITSMWQQVRQHSQRLVLLIDAPNSSAWVQALRNMPRQEQLQMSLCIQASGSPPPPNQPDAGSTTYPIGTFMKGFMRCNRFKEDLPAGMCPSYHSTWMCSSLVDFGSPLKFLSGHAQEARHQLLVGEAPGAEVFLGQMDHVQDLESSAGTGHMHRVASLNHLYSSQVSNDLHSASQTGSQGQSVPHSECASGDHFMPLMSEPQITQRELASDSQLACWDSNRRRPLRGVAAAAAEEEQQREAPSEPRAPADMPPHPRGPGLGRGPSHQSYCVENSSGFHDQLFDMLDLELKRQYRLSRRFEIDGHQELLSIIDDAAPLADAASESESSCSLPLVPVRLTSSSGAVQGVPCNSVAASAVPSLTAADLEELQSNMVIAIGSSRLSKMTTLHDPDADAGPAKLPSRESSETDGTSYVRSDTEQADGCRRQSSTSQSGSDILGLGSSCKILGGSNLLLRRVLTPSLSGMSEAPSPSCRKPRRFEVSGDDRSSFLFNDDPERMEALRALRKDEAVLQGLGLDSLGSGEMQENLNA